jgi:hypothetical protein
MTREARNAQETPEPYERPTIVERTTVAPPLVGVPIGGSPLQF